MEKKWWKEAIVYQIYTRSYKDTNGDGIGDIRGIINSVDYIKSLGVSVIWLGPIYQSPNDDNGYDISDYRKIMKEFGTMEDFNELLSVLHKNGIKLIMDLVVNHTSDEHNWFIESRNSVNSEYRDYYIWRKPVDGKAPNNWSSFFQGSVWELDEKSGEYYLHLFSKKQPDLNWENKNVRNEIYDMMNYWLDMGIDGFRMDVVNLLSKTEGLPSVGDSNVLTWGGEHFINGPKIHEYISEMNERTLRGRDIMTVGEMPGVTLDEAIRFTKPDNNELQMVFQFEMVESQGYFGGSNALWDLKDLKRKVTKWQNGLSGKGWNSLYLNNHDQPRMVSKYGNDSTDEFRNKSAKMLATMLHTLQGTVYVYQGEEIGMTNISFSSIEDYRDIDTRNAYANMMSSGWRIEDALKHFYNHSRDNARTPFQWDDTRSAGFTTGTPWISVNPNYKQINVRQQENDPNSVLNYYRELISLRKKYDIIVYGDYTELLEDSDKIFAYKRRFDGQELLVFLNFSDTDTEIGLDFEISEDREILISNYYAFNLIKGKLKLRPYEAVAIYLKG